MSHTADEYAAPAAMVEVELEKKQQPVLSYAEEKKVYTASQEEVYEDSGEKSNPELVPIDADLHGPNKLRRVSDNMYVSASFASTYQQH